MVSAKAPPPGSQDEVENRPLGGTISTLTWSSDPEGTVHFVNQQWCEYTGLTFEESSGWGWKAAIHPDDLRILAQKWGTLSDANDGQPCEVRLRRSDGVFRRFSFRREPLRDQAGAVIRWYGTGIDIEYASQRELLHAAEKRTLEMVADGASLREVLDQLCSSIDIQVAPSVTTVLVMDANGKQLWQGGGQRVPEKWISTIIPVPVAFDAGLCGTAAFLKKRVIVSDVATEPNWPHQFRDLAIRSGIRAAWSEPILTKDNEVLGTFAFYSYQARVPCEEDLALIRGAGQIARIAIERQRSQEALRNALEEVRKSEARLRQVVDTIPTTAWTTLPDGYCDFLNQVWLDYAGITAEQARGWGWAEAIHPDDRTKLIEVWQSSLASGAPVDTEARIRRFDATYRWFLIRANPMRDESANIVKWYGTCIDIEDRKRGEEALRARELSWREIVDNIPGFVATTGATGEVEFLNRQTLEYFGKTAEDLKNWSLIGVVHPDDLPGVLQARKASIEAGRIYEVEHRCRRADGVYLWFQVRGLPVRDPEGKITAWYLLLTDIDDRKKAEEALQSSQRNLSLIISTIPTFAWSARPDGSADFLNQRWLDYAGLSAEQALGWGWTSAIHPDDSNRLKDYWRSIIATGEQGEIEVRMRRFDGEYRWFLIRASAVRDDSGTIVKWYGTNTDIDDRKRAEARVGQAYLRLAEAQRLSKTGSFITDLVADTHDWSEETFRIFDFDPEVKVTVHKVRDLIHPEDLPSFDAMIARAMTGADVDFVFRILTSRGIEKHLRGMARVMTQVESRPLFIGALQDVTESKTAEQALDKARSELAHVARITTLNALTASIAHEINQPLASLITNASICLRRLNADPPNVDGARETVVRTIRDGNRVSDVITRLRALFSKKEITLETLDLNEATREVIALSSSDLQRNRVVLRAELAENLPHVIGDRVQLQQVTLNLLRNASDAMVDVEDRPRQLLIRTQREGDDRVRLSVRDDGCGVKPQDFERLFEAFYTTKTGGMGIGLSVSRSIIERHHGRLWAEPNDGPGTTFSFSVPCD